MKRLLVLLLAAVVLPMASAVTAYAKYAVTDADVQRAQDAVSHGEKLFLSEFNNNVVMGVEGKPGVICKEALAKALGVNANKIVDDRASKSGI